MTTKNDANKNVLKLHQRRSGDEHFNFVREIDSTDLMALLREWSTSNHRYQLIENKDDFINELNLLEMSLELSIYFNGLGVYNFDAENNTVTCVLNYRDNLIELAPWVENET